MKQLMTLIAMAFLVASPAFANDVDVKICNSEGKKLHFQVAGNKAALTVDGTPTGPMTVEESQELPASELQNEEKKVGEKIVKARAYSIKDSQNDMLVLAVLEGKSGAKYLAAIMLEVNILGSTKLCR